MHYAPRYNAALADAVDDALARHSRQGTPVLDFGAGMGTFTRALSLRGWSVQPLEPERAYAEAFQGHPLPLITGLEQTLDETYSGAFSLNVLEHISEDVATLKTLHRVLQPRAPLYLYVPAHPWLFSAMDVAVGHVRRYQKAELVAKLQQAGFEVQQTGFADSLGFLASLLLKAQGSNPTAGQVAAYDQWVFPLSKTLDRVTRGLVGKNLWVLALRGAAPA